MCSICPLSIKVPWGMLPQFKFEGPLIEMQVLQSGMEGSQINNNHLPAAILPELPKMCFYGAWTSEFPLQMQQALHTKRPHTTTINMEELWLNLAPLPDAKGKGGENHSPAAGPSISFLHLCSLPIKCYEFKMGRFSSSRKGSGICPLDSHLFSFSGKNKNKKHCRHGVSHG